MRFSVKCTSLSKTAFSAQDQHVLSFSHWVQLILAFFTKLQEFVQKSVFSIKSEPIVIFTAGAPLFSDFQQSARVCKKQRFQPKISTFCHFRIGHTTFCTFQQSAPVCTKQSLHPGSECFVIFALGSPSFSHF